jgi:phospholipid/cholesterol/gamma-HCH transport system substrate-binding protein
METRANHLLIGAFVLALVVGLFGFILWLAKVEIDREFEFYYVYFDSSVAGLSTASEVRYNGIPVGSVTEIIIDPIDPRRVRVSIELASTTPVREDTVASLEPQGITGVFYINLSSADPESPPLVAKEGEELPVIASRPSRFEELFAGAPRALDQFIILTNQAARFFDEQNRQAVAGILGDIKVLTGTLADRADKLAQTIDNIESTSRELKDAAVSVRSATLQVENLVASVDTTLAVARDTLESTDETLAVARGTMAGADELLTNDLRELVDDARATMRSVSRTSDELQGLVADNREPFSEFSAEGLYEFSRLINESRFLVGSLTRLAERLETGPAEFLFGDTEQGFKAE